MSQKRITVYVETETPDDAATNKEQADQIWYFAERIADFAVLSVDVDPVVTIKAQNPLETLRLLEDGNTYHVEMREEDSPTWTRVLTTKDLNEAVNEYQQRGG